MVISNGKYQTISESFVKNSQDTIFTLGMATFVANCVLPIIEVKANLDDQPMHFGSSKPLHKSTFVDLGDLSDKDGNFGIGFNLFNACDRKIVVLQGPSEILCWCF
jgi:hypothetical protein